MAENGKEKLKMKTVSGTEFDDELTFSPEEMQPFEVAEVLESDLIMGKTLKQIKKARRLFGPNDIRSEFRLSFRESLKNQARGLIGLFLLICSTLMYLFRPNEPTYLVMGKNPRKDRLCSKHGKICCRGYNLFECLCRIPRKHRAEASQKVFVAQGKGCEKRRGDVDRFASARSG